ncbi:hypothetical protein N234_36745 [Ralstonia pickettii DTP0602]|nr:hypothetical protein N234_36745 [Ralstonia pickettii DTP0602]
MTHIARFTGDFGLAVQFGIGIGLGLVRLVAALATLEVSAVAIVIVAAILAYKALVVGPRPKKKWPSPVEYRIQPLGA